MHRRTHPLDRRPAIIRFDRNVAIPLNNVVTTGPKAFMSDHNALMSDHDAPSYREGFARSQIRPLPNTL